MPLSTILRAAASLLALIVTCGTLAGAPASSVQDEFDAASAAAQAARVEGPSRIALRDQAVLDLPAGFSYIPVAQAARLMHAMGNPTDNGFMGLVVGEAMNGFVSIRHEESGHVRDDDARDWNASELLNNLREGAEAGNEERRQRGIPEFVVGGWVEAPAYDTTTHRLVWSAEIRDKAPGDGGASPGVNYNTYQLGRDGYISMNLVTNLDGVDSQKPLARLLLDGLSFNEGKRYADFNADTDSVAPYGLAALVGGIAAKKLGLLATAGIFLAKFWKIAAIAAVGFGVGLKRLFGRKTDA
jgi:uncharacterized membrane-anchored protein